MLVLPVCAWQHDGDVSQSAAAKAIPPEVSAVFQRYCHDCHGSATPRAKLSLEALDREFTDSRWVRVHDKLVAGEMPPKNRRQPSLEDRKLVSDWLRRQLHDASLAKQQKDGRVVLRRLNVTEYETTLHDLLGTPVAARDLLPEDNVAAGFDNVSAVLDVSPVHLLRYQDAAERVLRTVIPRALPTKFRERRTGREIAEKSRQFAGALGTSARLSGDEVVIYANLYGHIVIGSPPVPEPGRYRVRASMYAAGSDHKPIPVRWAHGMPWGRDEKSVCVVHDVSADKPSVIEDEFELRKAGELIDFTGWSLSPQRAFEEAHKGKPLDQYQGPGLVVQWVEVEGPLGAFPPKGYRRLFGDLPLKPAYGRGPLQVYSARPREDAAWLMRSFLPMAFRRPVSADLRAYFVKVVHSALDKKMSFEDAMLLGYKAALCSPHFLYLTEPLGGVRKDQAVRLDDFAVAARLSYFLWSTLPDLELLQLAFKGELSKPEVLHAQVERMLNDPKVHRFIENFAGQWLDLRKIDATTPDPQTYGEFDAFLFWSMPRETQLFFEEVLRGDRGLTEFVTSDWTYLNERLATHYGIPGVVGGEMRLVKLPPGCHRGGVLTQASILKVTADGTKTSPVLRGKWVLDRILGQPPAPPPADISAIEPDIRGATTIRQQLDRHRNTAACASCHRHIDPPGFALESFDVIGGWRDFYRGTVYRRDAVVELANYPGRQVVRGLEVEKGGRTHDGLLFQNIDEYKQILLADKDQLARNLAEKLLIYATGAAIQFADREVVEQLVADSRAKNYGLRSLIHDVVQSRVFLQK
jgi:mono/diheme cytochrome c family protein